MPLLFRFNTQPPERRYCSDWLWGGQKRAITTPAGNSRRGSHVEARARGIHRADGRRTFFRPGLVQDESTLIMRAPAFPNCNPRTRAWRARGTGVRIPGLPAASVRLRSLTICLKQLVWALARAIVPEPTPTGACTPRIGSKKLTCLYVFLL